MQNDRTPSSGVRACIAALGQALALVLALLSAAPAAAQPRTPTPAELFDWAESAYAAYFPGRPATQRLEPYEYRYYPQTGNYVGVAGTGVYVLGPVAGSSVTPLYLGELANYACLVHRYSCTASGGWPQRTVTLVVPFAAGGPSDTVARQLAQALQAVWGQSVVVRNTTGAGGTTGADEVARAAPDGHTLLYTHQIMAASPTLYRRLPHVPLRDFEFLGLAVEAPLALVSRSGLAAADFDALRASLATRRARAAHAGVTSASYLCMLLLESGLATTFTPVSYAGLAPAITDTIGQQADLLCADVGSLAPQVQSGQLRGQAVTSARRWSGAGYATLPTLGERGVAGFPLTSWFGLYAPKGVPDAVQDGVQRGLRTVLQDAALRSRLAALGHAVVDDERLSPASHRRYVDIETQRYAPLLVKAGQYAD